MKMEFVHKQLQEWGEIMVTTATGTAFEIHVGDTKFDFENRMIYLKSADSEFVIEGDSIEIIEKHYGHPAKGH